VRVQLRVVELMHVRVGLNSEPWLCYHARRPLYANPIIKKGDMEGARGPPIQWL
jgi:hypothetical protein